MATSKRSRKTTKRRPKKRVTKKDALIHFTATRKGTARMKPKADGSDGGVWLKIGPITWLQRKNGKINPRVKRAALKAFRKFQKG